MATHRIPISGGAVPDSTGVAYWLPYNVFATNDQWRHLVMVFGDVGDATQPSAAHGFYGSFIVPENYNAGAVIGIEWNTTKTSGAVVFDFVYRAVGGNDAESLDQTGTQESLSVTDTAGSAAHEKMQASVNPTDGNFSPGDLVEYYITRDGADASDTLAGVAMIHGLFFEYTD